MATTPRSRPHIELRIAGGNGLWEQGYAAGYDDGQFMGRRRGDERRFWWGVFAGVLLCGCIALLSVYLVR